MDKIFTLFAVGLFVIGCVTDTGSGLTQKDFNQIWTEHTKTYVCSDLTDDEYFEQLWEKHEPFFEENRKKAFKPKPVEETKAEWKKTVLLGRHNLQRNRCFGKLSLTSNCCANHGGVSPKYSDGSGHILCNDGWQSDCMVW